MKLHREAIERVAIDPDRDALPPCRQRSAPRCHRSASVHRYDLDVSNSMVSEAQHVISMGRIERRQASDPQDASPPKFTATPGLHSGATADVGLRSRRSASRSRVVGNRKTAPLAAALVAAS